MKWLRTAKQYILFDQFQLHVALCIGNLIYMFIYLHLYESLTICGLDMREFGFEDYQNRLNAS